jgi:hypothetical protein
MNFDGFLVGGIQGSARRCGVVVLTNGHIYGGDGQYFFTGCYSQNGDKLGGKVKVVYHNGNPTSIFGPDPNNFYVPHLSGQIIEGDESPRMLLSGERGDGRRLSIVLNRIESFEA